jgi:hypothetical protein
MIYLIIGILGIAVFKKDTVVELLEIAAAHVLNTMDKAWNKIVN